ncbi:hypothetical protein PF011_g15021, partial [Phytophthora fragariae]
DNLNVPLAVTTPIFLALLAIVFYSWYHVEKNLSIHSIFTRRREAWYWLAVLVSFALGTSAGDLIAEKLDVGYGNSLVVFAGCIAVVGLLWYFKEVNGVFCFWVVYVLTRPLGATLGDLMSQNPADSVGSGSGSSSESSSLSSSEGSDSDSGEALPSGWKAGLNLGTTVTSMIFLFLIAVLVIFLAVTKKDTLKAEPVRADLEKGQQVEVTLASHEFTMLPDSTHH